MREPCQANVLTRAVPNRTYVCIYVPGIYIYIYTFILYAIEVPALFDRNISTQPYSQYIRIAYLYLQAHFIVYRGTYHCRSHRGLVFTLYFDEYLTRGIVDRLAVSVFSGHSFGVLLY